MTSAVAPPSVSSPQSEDGREDGSEQAEVRRICLDYVTSWYEADASRMEMAVHPELAKRFVRALPSGAEFLDELGASKLVQWTASGAGRTIPPEHRHQEVTLLEQFFRAAIVKVLTATGVEYLQLLKIGDGWKIVNILGESREVKPYTASLFVSTSAGTDPSGVATERIVDAARGYAEGWDFGDVSRVASMAHPQWSKKCVRLTDAGGFFLESWGAQKMLRWIPSKEHEAELTDERIDINVLDHSGTIAAAKVEWEFQADGTPQSIDYLALAHTKDGWQAVNIVWEDDRRQGGPVIADGDWEIWQL